MSVKVEWADSSKTVILQVFEDPWTVEEHRDSLYLIGEMVASQGHTVHSIADMTTSQFAPGRMMVNTRVAESVIQPNSGLLFIVKPSSVIMSIVAAAQRFMPRTSNKLHMVATVEEALARIAQYKAVLEQA